jgi:hypothetical protein
MSKQIKFTYFSKDDFERLVTKVFDYIEKLENESKENCKVYFSGEFDSNQTDFERQSTLLMIGVLSSSKYTGLILLRFLRMIIDNNDLFWTDIQDKYEEYESNSNKEEPIIKSSKTIKELAESFVEHEKTCLLSFNINNTFERKIYQRTGEEKMIKNKFHQVDLWTLQRIREEFENIFM